MREGGKLAGATGRARPPLDSRLEEKREMRQALGAERE